MPPQEPVQLQEQVEGYFSREGFTLQNENEGFVAAYRPALGGDKETVMVWLPQLSLDDHARHRLSQIEVRLLDDIEATISQHQTARRTVLVPTTEGLTRDFRSEAHKLGVKILVPIQFFDAPFRIEEAQDSASTIGALRDSNLIKERVPQPYTVDSQNEPQSNDDLLNTLKDKFIQHRRRPSLRIVVGPAGAGKSLLFRSLFTVLYDHFLEQKKGHSNFPRPIPLLPEYLRNAFNIRTNALIEAFLRTDVATPVQSEVFEWMLENGYSTWLFDGLDELYAGDKHFFGYILDLLTRPNTQAQILICARDSLLTTNEEFAQFLEEFGDDSPIELYRLSDWENSSKRALAWLRLEGRIPRKGANDTKAVSSFLNTISQNHALQKISRVPYYCDLMLDAFKDKSFREFNDEFSVLEHAIEKILDREADKGLLFEDYFDSGGLKEWLEVTATEVYQANYKGLSIEDVKVYAGMVIKSSLSEEECTQAVTSLVHFPIFTEGMTPGTVNFKHELIAEYLAAKYLFRELQKNPHRIANYIGDKLDFAESLALRFISKEIANNEEAKAEIVKALQAPNATGRAFTYLFQILITADPNTGIFKDHPKLLESRDLRGIVFKDLDLDNVSFRNSDLAEAKFVSCSLREAQFEGTRLSRTHFNELNDSSSLIGANFANLQRCQSIKVNGKHLNDRGDLWEWVQRNTSTQTLGMDPCPAAMQLNVLFSKYVHQDGSGRRDELTELALLRGRRHPGAPRPEECVNECRRHGYLVAPNQRQRLRRAQGERYDEMVEYVKDWKLSSGIREMLDSLCSRRDCLHIPF